MRKELEYVGRMIRWNGTKEFIKRNGEFINIALVHHGIL